MIHVTVAYLIRALLTGQSKNCPSTFVYSTTGNRLIATYFKMLVKVIGRIFLDTVEISYFIAVSLSVFEDFNLLATSF